MLAHPAVRCAAATAAAAALPARASITVSAFASTSSASAVPMAAMPALACSSFGWQPVRRASSAPRPTAAAAAASSSAAPATAATAIPTRPRASIDSDASPFQPAFASYAPLTRAQLPPMELPGLLTRLMDRLRGTSYAEFHQRAYSLYNAARAHPLATPTPEELDQLRARHQAQVQAARASTGKGGVQVAPFVPPATRLLALGLGDDELTRLRLVSVHVWLLVTAMQQSVIGPEALKGWGHLQPPSETEQADAANGRKRLSADQRRLVGRIYDLLWHEMTPFLQATHGELKVSSTLRNAVQHWYANFLALDVAWQEARAPGSLEAARAAANPNMPSQSVSGDVVAAPLPKGVDALAAEVWRIFWLGDVRARKKDVYVLTTYLVLQARQLSQFSNEQLWSGKDLSWTAASVAKHNATGEDMMSRVLGVPRSRWANNEFSSWKTPILDDKIGLSFKGN